MELNTYFLTQCRASSVLLNARATEYKPLVSGINNKKQDGYVATYFFDGFKIDISYIERGNMAYAQQTIWLSFYLDCDPTIPFSLYDILAFIEPDNFNCYTYTYVDSKELMRDCFGEINELLISLVPKLTSALENGIEKNKIIMSQRESINRYFGDNVLESGEMLGGTADKLIGMMLKNFYDTQIESAIIGAQSLFYNGKNEKALKKLKKAKYRSQYHENLIKHIENGGSCHNTSATVKNASVQKGESRHSGGVKGVFKLIGLSVFFDLLISLVLFGLLCLICFISFKDSNYLVGIQENLGIIPSFGILLSIALSTHYIKYREQKVKSQNDKTVYSPKPTKSFGSFLKYFTIVGECIAILGLFTSVNSTTVFYEESFKYSEEVFPLSQSEIDYTAIDYFAYVEGFNINGNFQKDSHIIAVTKNGTKIDLYNSTYSSASEFKKDSADFLMEKGITFKTFKTPDEIE